MRNVELWTLAEQDKLEKWSVFVDQEGNEIIWTGKSFQPNTEAEDKYVGMCVGDEWSFIGIEEPTE